VTLLASALTAVMNLPMLRALRTAVPHDTGDPLYFAWQLSWIGHALATDPTSLYRPPLYLGADNNLAYTDAVIGYTPLAWALGSGAGAEGAVRLVNAAVLMSIVMSFLGAYALARVLGSGIPGALLAGAGFAFAPWRLEQITHINVMSTGVAALALAALCRGHGWSLRTRWRPERVHAGWILTGWLLAAVQLTYGFAGGVMFGWVLALTVGLGLLGTWLRFRRTGGSSTPSRRTLRAAALSESVGGLTFAVVGLILARPYFWVVEQFPEARRDESWLFLSPPWRGLLTAPDTNLWWGERHAAWRKELVWVPEMVLLPGFVLIGVAVLGLALSAWPLRRRLGLLLALTILVVLSLGIRFPGDGKYTYLPLYHHLPGLDALRTPGRLVIWITLGLGLLGAGAVTLLSDRARELLDRLAAANRTRPERRGRAGAALLTIATAVTAVGLTAPAVAVTLEGRGNVTMQEVSFPAGDLNALPQPVLVLPFDTFRDYHVMAWQTDGWPRLANGSSSFEPAYQVNLRKALASFPSAGSLAEVRRRGIATVVVVPSWAPGTPWAGAATASIDGLGISRSQVGNLVVFDTR
jgi:hypothetical protein